MARLRDARGPVRGRARPRSLAPPASPGHGDRNPVLPASAHKLPGTGEEGNVSGPVTQAQGRDANANVLTAVGREARGALTPAFQAVTDHPFSFSDSIEWKRSHFILSQNKNK